MKASLRFWGVHENLYEPGARVSSVAPGGIGSLVVMLRVSLSESSAVNVRTVSLPTLKLTGPVGAPDTDGTEVAEEHKNEILRNRSDFWPRKTPEFVLL